MLIGSPSALGTGTRPAVTRTSLRDALALGPDAWDRVLASSKTASPFSGWAWHDAWADSAPPADVDKSEALVLHGPDGSLQAVLPLLARRLTFRRVAVNALTWAIGDLGCPDHLDVLAMPHADLGALVPALEATPWDVIILSNLAEGAPNAERLGTALSRHGHAVRQQPLFVCPRLELPETWDAYLATLSPTRRQVLRRKERNLHREHAVVLADYGDDRVDEGWRHLLALHEQRWSGSGAFRDAAVERLQHAFARLMAQRQRLWLSTLHLDGQPAAAWYGFAAEDTVYFYQSGRDPRWERDSVGVILMGMMIRHAIARGYKWFDFLRGDEGYKGQWTSSRRHTTEMVVFRSGWRGQGVQTLDWAARLRDRLQADRSPGAPSQEHGHD
jgi:CelD/BcsL family acetyltransferase involved in cellulose biosynthesis